MSEIPGTVDLGGEPSEPGDELGVTTHGAAPRPLPFTPSRMVGRGGSSEVFEAYDPVLRRRLALKLLSIPSDGPRFLREARIMAQLEHPHIVPVHDYGIAPDGTAWISMALVEGQTLDAWARDLGARRLTREGVLDVLDIIDRVCDAVAYAHSRGVLHLDLKPTNIMVSAFGRVMLMDWGIARVEDAHLQTSAGSYGTPGFVAPEQVNTPDAVDERTDVFGLGGVLYAILTHAPPHAEDTDAARLRAAGERPVRRPSDLGREVPAALIDLIMSALAFEPEARPASISALQATLREIRRSPWSLPRRHVAAGEAIVRIGEVGDEAFVIASGTCEVREADGEVLRTLGEGDVFGELAVLTRATRSKDVVAVDDVVLHVVSRSAMGTGLGLGTWAGRFARALARRFQEAEAREDETR